MRISDWSSDVCSSDLTRLDHRPDSSEEGYGGSLRIEQDVGFADLVSVSAFRKSDGVYRTDLDYSGQPFYNDDLGDQDDQITQEFQEHGRASCRERVCKYV